MCRYYCLLRLALALFLLTVSVTDGRVTFGKLNNQMDYLINENVI